VGGGFFLSPPVFGCWFFFFFFFFGFFFCFLVCVCWVGVGGMEIVTDSAGSVSFS